MLLKYLGIAKEALYTYKDCWHILNWEFWQPRVGSDVEIKKIGGKNKIVEGDEALMGKNMDI